MVVESGTGVSIGFTRERVRGTTPAGIGTPVDNVEAEATATLGAGFSMFKRAAGSFVTDGFAVGQLVQAEGFADTDINANFRVALVSAGELEVIDVGDIIDDEAAAAGQKVRILLETLRATSRAMDLEKETLESEEVDTVNRQVSDLRHGFNSVAGTPGFQFSRLDYDELIEIGFGALFKEPTAVSGINLGANTSTKVFDRASGSFITDGYRVGDVIEVGGFGDANDANWIVTAVIALEVTVHDPDNIMVTNAAAGSRTLSLKGLRCDIGSTLETMYMERQFSGTTKYQKFNGVVINEMPMSVTPRAIVGGSFNLLGMSSPKMTATSESGVALVAKSAAEPYAAFDGTMLEGGAAIAVVTAVDWALNNNRTLEAVVGSKTSPDVFEGDARVNGNVVAFFEGQALHDKFVDETVTTIILKLDDPDGVNFSAVVFPQVKYTGAGIDPPQRGPVPQAMPFAALMHATYKTSMWIQMSHL